MYPVGSSVGVAFSSPPPPIYRLSLTPPSTLRLSFSVKYAPGRGRAVRGRLPCTLRAPRVCAHLLFILPPFTYGFRFSTHTRIFVVKYASEFIRHACRALAIALLRHRR